MSIYDVTQLWTLSPLRDPPVTLELLDPMDLLDPE